MRAHERARVGHQGVHTQTLEAYGHGLHAVQYEELATGLESLGATPVRLQARTVMVIAGHVLSPIRYAKTDVPVTAARLRRAAGLRFDLLLRHGPEPLRGELDLGLQDTHAQEIHGDLSRLAPEVLPDRYLLRHHHEPLTFAGLTNARLTFMALEERSHLGDGSGVTSSSPICSPDS